MFSDGKCQRSPRDPFYCLLLPVPERRNKQQEECIELVYISWQRNGAGKEWYVRSMQGRKV